MTKRNKLFARLIVDEWKARYAKCYLYPWMQINYREFIRSQSRKNNCYALALRQIGG